MQNSVAIGVNTNYVEAKRLYLADSNHIERAWQLGRACFDRAAFATNNAERARIAEEGIAVCRAATVRNPESAPVHYYLGMNLGQLADTKRNLAALRIVKEMEREFLAADRLDEKLDYAGPDRNLGLLYWQAPVIASIGSRSKARQHLQRAAELAPDYPENRLNLLEAYLKWGDYTGARRELEALEKLWPKAEKQLTGEGWALSWEDWKTRLQAAKQKLGRIKTRPE